MITNKQKIEKLEILLSRAILSLHPDNSILLDNNDVWKSIDKIIEIDRYIKELHLHDQQQKHSIH